MKNISKLAVLSMIFGIAGLRALHAEDPAIGLPAPDFALTDINGEKRSLSEYKGKFVVLEWINHGCPFVKKHYNSKNMQNLQRDVKAKGAVWISICSSGEGKQGYYSPNEWKKMTKKMKANPTAIVLDGAGAVGKTYGAKTTPHMFVVDPQGFLIYKGAIDDKASTDPEDVAGAKNYVRAALDEAMSGNKVSVPSTQSYGCSVKYK